MRARWARFTIAATATAALAGVGVLIGPSASAATPIVLGSCNTSVQGAPGTPVELAPSAVVGLLGPVLGSTLTGEFAALPPIPLGALPTGTGTITGGQIASAVNAQVSKLQLPLLGPILSTLTGGVQSALTSACQIGMDGINAAAGTVQSGAAAVASGAQQVVGGLTGASGAGGSGGGASQSGPGSGGPAQASGPGGGSSGGAANSSMPQSNSPVLGGLPTNSYPMDTTASGLYQLLAYDLAESPSARYGGIPYATAGL
ncbi:MAG TPA: hypothetical protein VG317_21925, partial [Pseudonocardiaceae bacterium]|nr:hypothetical protein [Pseudonocardiaceae bacterium]